MGELLAGINNLHGKSIHGILMISRPGSGLKCGDAASEEE